MAVERAHLLQGGEGIRYRDKCGIPILVGREVPIGDDKGTDTPAVERLDVLVSILLLCDKGKEKRSLGEGERPGVGQECGDHTTVPDRWVSQC